MIPQEIVARLTTFLSTNTNQYRVWLPGAGHEQKVINDDNEGYRERELAQLVAKVRSAHLPHKIYFSKLRKAASALEHWNYSQLQNTIGNKIEEALLTLTPLLKKIYQTDQEKISKNEILLQYSYLKTLYDYMYQLRIHEDQYVKYDYWYQLKKDNSKDFEIKMVLQLINNIGGKNYTFVQNIEQEQDLIKIEMAAVQIQLLVKHSTQPKSDLFYAQEIPVLLAQIACIKQSFEEGISIHNLDCKLTEIAEAERESFVQKIIAGKQGEIDSLKEANNRLQSKVEEMQERSTTSTRRYGLSSPSTETQQRLQQDMTFS